MDSQLSDYTISMVSSFYTVFAYTDNRKDDYTRVRGIPCAFVAKIYICIYMWRQRVYYCSLSFVVSDFCYGVINTKPITKTKNGTLIRSAGRTLRRDLHLAVISKRTICFLYARARQEQDSKIIYT